MSFKSKANSDEDICWASVWSFVSSRVSNKSEFLWRNFLSVSLKLRKFISCKPKRILMKTFLESQFEVISVYEFQTKVNSYGDICGDSVRGYVGLWVWNKSEFWWRHFLSPSLKLCKFMNFKKKRILTETYFSSQFEVM